MKATGIVRKIDELGRIVLPVELRRTLHIDDKSAVEIYTEDNRIILKKYQPTCIFCGSSDTLHMFAGQYVCTACIHQLCQGA